MNPKERYYSGVARETIHRITANRENWTSFLATMARNYDFTYPEQVMIYAQRPNATLCKPYEEWNTDQYQQLSLNLFLSESEQISFIDEAESKTLSAFSLSENQIDQVLTVGGNEANLRMMVALEYMKGKSTEEIAKRLPALYRGSNGFKLDSHEVSAWFDEQCIHLARGKTARFAPSRQIVSWQEAAERIGKLLENGEYATNVELVEAPGYERTKVAESLWYL